MNSDNFRIIGVTRESVTIEIIDSRKFNDEFNIGSYIKIPYRYNEANCMIGIIKNYKIKNLDTEKDNEQSSTTKQSQQTSRGDTFIIEIELVGSYIKKEEEYIFERGSYGIPLPPNNGIELVSPEDFRNIFSCNIKKDERFVFSKLAQNQNIDVVVNGNKFFNKHFAIVGSTGSGKSHTVATILQQAIKEKSEDFALNNSHIVLFDIHGEYQKAFPNANHIHSENIKIPYWLFDSDELIDLFIESGEKESHNQVSQLRYAITENKKRYNQDLPQDRIYFDSPIKFDIHEVFKYVKNMNNEVFSKDSDDLLLSDGSKIIKKINDYFDNLYDFGSTGNAKTDGTKGAYKGDFERFILRLENTINNPRLKFLFNDVDDATLVDILKQFLDYRDTNANITVIDLSGIPFEVLSITVSLISRILFEYGYYYKKLLNGRSDCETPLLLVYEEAHKYVPRSDLVKYRASKNAIERIAKEGHKYGVTLGIISQRPSEISETIFSQCNNFISMRLTNPDDQNYVKRLLPDTMGDLTSYLSSLQSGEAIIIGESIILPSLVKINVTDVKPHSTDIKYLDIWKEKWKDHVLFDSITKEWIK